jgi:hypothetical protein
MSAKLNTIFGKVKSEEDRQNATSLARMFLSAREKSTAVRGKSSDDERTGRTKHGTTVKMRTGKVGKTGAFPAATDGRCYDPRQLLVVRTAADQEGAAVASAIAILGRCTLGRSRSARNASSSATRPARRSAISFDD